MAMLAPRGGAPAQPKRRRTDPAPPPAHGPDATVPSDGSRTVPAAARLSLLAHAADNRPPSPADAAGDRPPSAAAPRTTSDIWIQCDPGSVRPCGLLPGRPRFFPLLPCVPAVGVTYPSDGAFVVLPRAMPHCTAPADPNDKAALLAQLVEFREWDSSYASYFARPVHGYVFVGRVPAQLLSTLYRATCRLLDAGRRDARMTSGIYSWDEKKSTHEALSDVPDVPDNTRPREAPSKVKTPSKVKILVEELDPAGREAFSDLCMPDTSHYFTEVGQPPGALLEVHALRQEGRPGRFLVHVDKFAKGGSGASSLVSTSVVVRTSLQTKVVFFFGNRRRSRSSW